MQDASGPEEHPFVRAALGGIRVGRLWCWVEFRGGLEGNARLGGEGQHPGVWRPLKVATGFERGRAIGERELRRGLRAVKELRSSGRLAFAREEEGITGDRCVVFGMRGRRENGEDEEQGRAF